MLARRDGSPTADGSGIRAVMGSASCGLVPHVTVVAVSAASRVTSRWKTASGSESSARQWARACAHPAPRGASGRPSR